VPESAGFSPVQNPKLIATYPTGSPALAVSRGLDRDRVVDESGNETVVFGRRGSRPFDLAEMQKFYLLDGSPYTVENVFEKDGRLQTRSGTELQPAAQYQPVAVETPPAPPAEARLTRPGP